MARPSQGAVLACVAALGLSVSGCGSDTGDNDGATTTPEPLTCPAACPANASSRITEPSGFTDNTGFADGNACCDICAVPGAVKIPPGKNGTYDWDFITMDALYIPQFCQALAEGHDFTLTNPENSTCTDSKLHLNGFQLHGLWPNYDSDWAACCQTPSPLSKEEVSGWNFSFDLQQYWVDAGVGPGCDACFNLNHEWQKHGGCFTNKPEAYFTAGLDLFKAWQGPRDVSPFDYLASAMATWSLEGTFFMNSTKLQETCGLGLHGPCHVGPEENQELQASTSTSDRFSPIADFSDFLGSSTLRGELASSTPSAFGGFWSRVRLG